MTQKEILEFINKNMSCALATCVNNKPHVRGMWMYRADEKGIIFHTGVMRDLYKQLRTNPNIELCFHNGDPQNLVQVRVSGIAVPENDSKLREEIISQRPFLKPIVAQYGQECIAVFRVKEMAATVWSMAKNLEPKECVVIK
ncbi:MAG: pyridoxamine 5'-phosphate oxidase family protein [bacterium]|nr:pyridoxamine 5'-phosphate oxidase family protein [bacterium]